jgi:hypothetical protein
MAVVSSAGGVHRGEDTGHDPCEGERYGEEFASFGHCFHLLLFPIALCFRATTGPCSRSSLSAVPHGTGRDPQCRGRFGIRVKSGHRRERRRIGGGPRRLTFPDAESYGTVQSLGGSGRHRKLLSWLGPRIEQMSKSGSARAIIDRATNLKNGISATP